MRSPCLEACASQVVIGGTVFGSEKFGWIAGPCAIESSAQLSSCVVELGRQESIWYVGLRKNSFFPLFPR